MRLSDEEYIYRKEISEKKRIGYGAFCKKNGSKSKKCNFPSDYLSKKEKLKMNSDCMSWNLNDFYTYNDFKKMPADVQVLYLQKLTDTYRVGINVIGEVLFELAKGTFNSYISDHGIKDKIKWNNLSGRAAAAYNAEFKRKIDHMRVAIVDRIPNDDEEETEENEDREVVEAEIEKAMDSFNKTVTKIVQPIDPPVEVEDPDDIFRPDPISCRFVSKGFNLDLFKFLACMYKEKNPTVTIYISTEEDEHVSRL